VVSRHLPLPLEAPWIVCNRRQAREIDVSEEQGTSTHLHKPEMSPRKRRRDQAFSDEAIEAGPVLIEGETISSEKQRAEKEQEVWEAIREAHFEG
jgi:hypothetical protein